MNRSSVFSNLKAAFCRVSTTVLIGSGLLCAASVHAQVPTLLWRTNVNATLFAVDSNTNVYVNANGTVITLNSQGVPFATNHLCPVPSIAPSYALRDFSGNFYFAGNADGTNDFGGKIIVSGWTNVTPQFGKWQPGYPTGFLAKYAPNGTLLWATRIDGQIAGSNVVSDLVLNPDNSVTVGIYSTLVFAQIVQFSPTGSNLWQTTDLGPAGPSYSCGPVKLTGMLGTNGGFSLYRNGQGVVPEGHYSSSGTHPFDQGLHFTPVTIPSGKPVITLANEIYLAGFGLSGPGSNILQKAAFGGSILWAQPIGSVEQWVLNSDNKGNVYLSGTDGSFSEYSSAGSSVWSYNYGSPAVLGMSDLTGNRLVQFADNSIAMLSADPGAVAPSVHLKSQAGDGATAAGFQFSLSGNAGSTFQILWSTNFNSWQSMGYVTNGTGEVQVLDSDATNQLHKFYRIVP